MTSTWSRTPSIRSPARHPFLAKPFLRGIIVLGQSLAIGMRALMVSSNHSLEEDEQLTSRQIGCRSRSP